MAAPGERPSMRLNARRSVLMIAALYVISLGATSEAAASSECTTAVSAVLADAVYDVPFCCGGLCAGSDACTVIVNGEKWVAVDVSSNWMNGFNAATYHNAATNETVVAFRGTEADKEKGKFDRFDVITDVGAVLSPGVGLTQWQYYDALNYFTEMQAKYSGDTISVTGHSLGGSLAMYVGNVTGVATTTFNALALNSDLADDGSLGGSANIANYYDTDDPVKCVNEIMGLTTVGSIDASRGSSAYCDGVKSALADYDAKLRDPNCDVLCRTQAAVDLGFIVKALGESMASAHSMAGMATTAQGACEASAEVGDLPDPHELPTVALPPAPELPPVGDLPDRELPVVSELPQPGDLPHAELPEVPDLPHVELPTVRDLPKVELP